VYQLTLLYSIMLHILITILNTFQINVRKVDLNLTNSMAFQPDQCWYLERVPIHMEGPAYLLQNAKEVVSFGRRVTTNDKVCNGPNVSRNHLKFVRYVVVVSLSL
jgi:hypothetical protein